MRFRNSLRDRLAMWLLILAVVPYTVFAILVGCVSWIWKVFNFNPYPFPEAAKMAEQKQFSPQEVDALAQQCAQALESHPQAAQLKQAAQMALGGGKGKWLELLQKLLPIILPLIISGMGGDTVSGQQGDSVTVS
jgi:hypothetical protein